MRKSFTRAVAFLLSVVLCVGLLPMRIFAEDTPKTWPTLTSLTLNEGAKLKAQKAAATNDRDIKAVTYENYAELKIIDDSSAQKTYSVGMVTLYVETALKSYAYKLTTGALNKAFPDTLPDGVKLTGNFEPLSFAKGKTEENGLSFAEFGTSAIYIYEFKIVVGEPPAWPTLTSLTLNEGAKLKAQKAAATNDRDIKAVTYENYAELKIIDDSSAQKTYSVGMVTLYVETALKSYAYKLTTGALNKAFPDTLPDGVTLTGNFEPLSFAKGKTEENGLSFAEFGTSAIYIYEFRIVVGEPPIDYPYPVIESLTAAQGAVLSGADGTKVPITGATFKNYKTAEDGARESEENIKISGEITIYILRALTDSKYTLASTALVATYSALDGYETNNIQGIFPAGDTSCTSYYYAFHSESNTQYRYRLTVQIGYPDNGMYVLEGSASRISPTKARVTFTASNAGIYYYACVDAGSVVPERPSSSSGYIAEGTNTFTIDGLTDGAKRVYIWGEDVSGNRAQPLVVDIPAEAVAYSLLLEIQSVGTDGVFRITANGQDVSFGKYLMLYTRASDCLYEGDVVTVWIGNPYTDKDLKSVTLIPVGSSEALDVQVDSAANSFTFTMPAANVNGKDSWRTYEESTETRYTLTATASTFDQTNASGIAMGSVVFKDEAGNIIKQAKAGTQVTATPVPSTTANPMLEFEFTGWSDASGFELTEDKTSSTPLTFTVGSDNVSLKANFEPKGTEITWGTNLSATAAGAPTVSFGAYVASPYRIKKGQRIGVSLIGTEWYDRYEFESWTIEKDGETLTDYTVQPVGTEGTPGYWTSPSLVVDGSTMTIIANFRERNWGSVNVTVNDSAMGSATATVNGKADVSQVFEDQTVTLTANPGERYMLEGWTVTDKDQQPIEVTTSADNANVATFVMPKKGGDVTAIANFKVNPDNASKDAVMTKAELYTYEEPKKLVASGSKEGTLFTITLASDVDTTHLSSMILKFAYSEHAKVMQGTTEWPADGHACGMALNEEKIFTVIAEDGTSKCDYTVKIVQQPKLSSEKAITSVELIYNNETFATGKLDEATSTWTITLDDDIDPTILSKFGTMDIKMKITYNGASLAQKGGYNDAGQTSWSSGTISCGVSPGSQQTFTVTAEDGSTKDYIIAITQPSVSDKPVVSNGDATRTSDKEATVTFTSSVAGSYYYKVVASGAAEPDIDTSKSGSAAVAGSNTITLNNLTAGARDIYIVVKNAAGDVSNKLKIAIPAFGEDPDKPDEGDFKITYTGPSGGKLVPSRTKANAGDVITVTVVPDAGMQMVAGSMKYTLGVAGGESTTITDGTFTMPSADVTLSCKWEAVKTSTDGITGFVIDGVAGVVDNTTNTISVVMAYGTDVTKLIPIISGNNIASISPASGQMVDFTNSVRYTVTLTDGTVKYYTVTVYVQEGTAADKMWDKLTDFYDQTPWWEYADHQVSTGHYPKYW